MTVATQWNLRPMQTDCLASLDGCGKSPLVRRLLAQRGISGGEAAERFLDEAWIGWVRESAPAGRSRASNRRPTRDVGRHQRHA